MQRPLRVAFVTFEYPPFVQGGAGDYAKNIARELAKLGNDVHVITPYLEGCDKCELKNGVSIHRVDFTNKTLLRAGSFWMSVRSKFPKIEETVGGFDVIHGNATSDLCLSKALTGKIPRVVTVHHLARDVVATLRPSMYTRVKGLVGETGITPLIEKICIRRADKIIAVSQYTEAKLASMYRIPLSIIEVIHNGWEEKGFVFAEREKAEIRTRHNITASRPVVLFVGRVDDRRKGLDILLEAFKEVLSSIDAAIVVVGSGNQKPYEKLSLALGIASRVIFTGFVGDDVLPKLYSLCDVYVCPSRLEGFGLTILDAMAAGKPVIAANVGSIPEIVKDEENGFLVKSGDKKGFAQAITQILGDAALARKMGDRNIRKVRECYSWAVAAQKTEQLYKLALNQT